MEEIKRRIILAGLLHDIGKLVYRAKRMPENHSNLGVEFLSEYMEKGEDILRAVKYHHSTALCNANLQADDISYLIYEGDNIASGSDRRANESSEGGFNIEAPLESVFNVFAGNDKSKKGFYLRGLLEDDAKMLYPAELQSIKASTEKYQELLNTLVSNFRQKSVDNMEPNELLQILEAIGSYIPSSTAKGEVADISLYDHMKLTAALAICLYDYLYSKGIYDYKSYCYGTKQKELRKENTYLLVSGDISGIQDFIYTIPSKGALKSLRGRSFYLELLMENVIDELLERLDLNRCNLIYNGGGNFYLLLPNTSQVLTELENVQNIINQWFLEKFGTRLYIAIGWAPCAANDFMVNSGNALGSIYSKARSLIAVQKHRRYNAYQLGQLFQPHSQINTVKDGARECSICHTSSTNLSLYGDAEETWACDMCCSLRNLGEELLKYDVLVVLDKMPDTKQKCVELPSLQGKRYLMAIAEKEVSQLSNIKRIYVKNLIYTGQQMATRLWMGDYITVSGTHTMELEELAKLAGGDKQASGIDRLGVMRADVDNLGAAFMAGFPEQYATLGRSAALSRQLSLFFKRYINNLCGGEINGINEDEYHKFAIFAVQPHKQRNVHIIYSGGDDMFIVGAWDDLLELSVDIREAFRRFTNNKLSFSAGIGIFDSKCPISEMARGTGLLESTAKDNPGKDSIAMFGIPSAESHASYTTASYGWEEFVQQVCGEKLTFCQRYLGYAGNEAVDRLPAGKGVLYRMLNLLNESRDNINLARFAYMLGRMEPPKDSPAYDSYAKVREKLYGWYQDKAARKQLMTALELIIYRIREKGE